MELRKLNAAKQLLIAKKAVSIYHFAADSGQGPRVWYVLALGIDREEAFLHAMAQEGAEVDINDYGDILAGGAGSAAPPEVLDALKERYGIELESL